MGNRLGRDQRKAATREQLLAAAATVFARKGYSAASVDDVAREAGFTKGAVYSNFATKQELVLELLEDRCRAWCNQIAEAYLVGEHAADWLENGARVLTQLSEHEADWYLLFIEIWTQAARAPALRSRLAQIYEDARRRATEVIEDRWREMGVRPAISPEMQATIFIAATDGFILQKLVDPERFPSGYLATGVNGLLAALVVSANRD